MDVSGGGGAAAPVRIGVLGAARILPEALCRPARALEGVEVAALAARDRNRAARQASRLGIPAVHPSYADLLSDRTIDAVYVPLPAALHARWVCEAVAAGKHVLCEKPFTSSARSAAEVAREVAPSALVVMEAYHSGHHPLLARLHEIIASGELGTVTEARAMACAPIPPGKDIRWNLALGGGGLLDVGYYALRLLRELFGEVTVERVSSRCRDGVDARMDATLLHGSGVRSSLRSSLWSGTLIASSLHVTGTRGSMRVSTPSHPQLSGRIRIEGAGGRRMERTTRRSSYEFQLEAFRDAVRGGPVVTGVVDAVAQLEAIDRIHAAAGMAPRPSSALQRIGD